MLTLLLLPACGGDAVDSARPGGTLWFADADGDGVGDAARLCEIVLETRERRFPAFERSADELRELGRETSWIGRFIEEYGELADGAAVDVVAAGSKWRVTDDANLQTLSIVQLGS